MKKWLLAVTLKRIFGGQTDNILTQIRKGFTVDIINNKLEMSFEQFPSDKINKALQNNNVSDEYIQDLLLTEKDTKYAFSILALLYPNLDYKNNNFHQDHLHPKSKYELLSEENKEKYGWNIHNSILNLQMLDENENKSKNDKDLNLWVEEQTRNIDKNQFLVNHIIPNIDLSLDNYSTFIEKRREMLFNKLKILLQ